MTDKRDIAHIFRERLNKLMARDGASAAGFARRCNLDRSALSQFLDPAQVRLPRAETLSSIAQAEAVSVDWLLGLTHDEDAVGEVVSLLGAERGAIGTEDSALAGWHREAAGYKIRYSPFSLPDLLCTPAVIHYEYGTATESYEAVKSEQSRHQLDYSRRPETDIEVVLPLARLRALAEGSGQWHGLSRRDREEQIAHMITLIEELYPTFRLFLYDGRMHHCAPFTVFGPSRAAVYLGDMYLVMNRSDHINALRDRFDGIIRVAAVGPDAAANWLRKLEVA